jgi:malate dehydrogenase
MTSLKVTILGTAPAGYRAAYDVARDGHEVVLFSTIPDYGAQMASTLHRSLAANGHPARVVGGDRWSETRWSDVVVIAGAPGQDPGTPGDGFDLAPPLVALIAQHRRRFPAAKVIVATNPVEPVCDLAHLRSGFPAGRIVGITGLVGSALFAAALKEVGGIDPTAVNCMVLGSGGDLMVPLVSQCRVGGAPLTTVLSQFEIDEAIRRMKAAARETDAQQSAWNEAAAAMAITRIVREITDPSRAVMPLSVFSPGFYGTGLGTFVVLPATINRGGAAASERVLALWQREIEQLQNASKEVAEAVRRLTSNHDK